MRRWDVRRSKKSELVGMLRDQSAVMGLSATNITSILEEY